MAITDDLRKTLSDPKPLYFAAGTADLAIQQARKVPGLVEQLCAEAPARIEAVRNTDPKAVQEKATARAREAQETFQAKVAELIGSLDTDLKKLGESAQDLALRGVGVAAEYAVKAREAYEKVAEHGEQTVRTWRGEAAEEIEDLAVAVEPKGEPKVQPLQPVKVEGEKPAGARTEPATARKTTTPAKKAPAGKPSTTSSSSTPSSASSSPSSASTTAKKTTPPAK